MVDDALAVARNGGFGKLVTSSDTRLVPPGAELRDVIAIYASGIAFIATGHATRSPVRSHLKLASQFGVNVLKCYDVPLSAIGALYSHFANGGLGHSVVTQTVKQSDIINVIRDVAARGASDLHVDVWQDRTTFSIKLHGELMVIGEQPRTYGIEWLGASHSFADQGSGDSQFHNQYSHSARISNFNASGLTLPPKVEALRCQYNPTINGGYNAVFRLIYTVDTAIAPEAAIKRLGYAGHHIEAFQRSTSSANGIDIKCGVVNSGKSTSMVAQIRLYQSMHDNKKRVITVEDPPEATIPNAVQFPIANASTPAERQRKYIAALSAMLRSDGNLLVIGEVRDAIAAELAVDAARTGHLCMATLHADSAFGALHRLEVMGLRRSVLADANLFRTLWAQVLVPVLCLRCAQPWTKAESKTDLDMRLRKIDTDHDLLRVRGPGCDNCQGNGLKGRTLACEVVETSDDMMDVYRERPHDVQTWWLNEAQGRTRLDHAISKMLLGSIDPYHVETVVGRIDVASFQPVAAPFAERAP